MDLQAVRRAIVKEVERQSAEEGLTQQEIAQRCRAAGSTLTQGNLPKLFDLERDYEAVQARTLFDLIEYGLRIPLSAFSAQLPVADLVTATWKRWSKKREERREEALKSS